MCMIGGRVVVRRLAPVKLDQLVFHGTIWLIRQCHHLPTLIPMFGCCVANMAEGMISGINSTSPPPLDVYFQLNRGHAHVKVFIKLPSLPFTITKEDGSSSHLSVILSPSNVS